jgi:hypothetical protein
MTAVPAMVLKFISSILGLESEIKAAEVGDHVETPTVGRLRLFGRRGRPYFVFIVEE